MDGVLPVPERRSKTKDLPVVADSTQPVLSPAVCAGAGLVMSEVVSGVSHATASDFEHYHNKTDFSTFCFIS